MKALIDKLTTHLTEEDKTLTELIETAENLNQSVSEGDVQKVSYYTAEFDKLSSAIETSESKRIEICSSIAFSMKTEAESLNLKDIIANTDKERSDKLKELRKTLKTKSKRLHNISKTNRIMLESNLQRIKDNFKALYSEAGKYAGYNRSSHSGNTFLNTRV